MGRASWIIITIVGALLLSMWAVFNRPDNVPLWPASIQGVSFSPFRPGQSPQEPKFPSDDQISKDLRLLTGKVRSVRTYSVEDTLGHVPLLARPYGMKVTVGIWLTDDLQENRREIDRFKQLFPAYGWNVSGIVVGNEVLLRGELTPEELAAYIDEVSEFVDDVPVTTAETWDIWLKDKTLAKHVDYIAVHVLPYWEGIPNSRAHDYVFERYEHVQARYPFKKVVLGEVGWPSEGRQRGGAVPSLQNQAKFLRHFLFEADRRGADYFALEAFDQIWKTSEGAVGRYWGIYDAQRTPKFPFNAPVTPVPEWPAIAGFSLAFAILILALLLRDSSGLVHGGRSFLVLVSYAISTAVVWLVYDYSSKYLTWEQVLVGIGLLAGAFCISIVILAEAHEWAESIWNKASPRNMQRTKRPSTHPKVSVHVPIYNEPPEMVIETLAALNRLDYPDYEVIVVDNNTEEPSSWLPVEAWCNQQENNKFRFFHVNPLSGFKAGALNYALQKTAADAELVAVIDSDYVVDPAWLMDCTALFEDSSVSIVQAPQDYRDDGQSAFKSMIYCEYAGFFGIGMVNRDARNAIIQHGTMTIVRRDALDGVEGWSEWCITEDAELGLRILAEGHRAIYVPKSYGRGLMPDNFLDYKKQRFRWAYGSVLIMRHHMRYFLGLGKSQLSSGQRYHFIAGWLPWMADGLSLMFNCVALGYAVLMICQPYVYTPPEITLSLLPIAFFAFKLIKMQVLYRWRMNATVRQSMAAGLAGLAVSHTISRAMLAGLKTRDIGFFRTPKLAEKHTFLKALSDAREELLFAIALTLAAIVIGFRDDAYLLDTKLWMLLLTIQSIPYYSAVLVSLISAYDKLPAKLINRASRQTLLARLPSVTPTSVTPDSAKLIG